MKKKIRFPLRLSGGAEVRTLEELREHFDLQAILEYYKSSKLLTWLEDRYLEGEAEAVQALDGAAPDFQRQLCEVFQVEYTGGDVDLEAIERRQERLKQLRSITDDAEYIQNIDCVAFDQEELVDLLDEGEERIYLCGEQFTVPASRKGITYVGINNPTVHISGKMPENAAELEIEFVGVICDNLLQKRLLELLRSAWRLRITKETIPEKLLKDFQCRKIPYFFEADNFYLYRRGYDEGIKWCRYEIATGQETVLTGEIAKGLTNAKIGSQLADKAGGPLKVCGDEIAFCCEYDSWCSVDLRTLLLQRYDGMHYKSSRFALSADYLAVFSDNSTSSRDSTEECIEIYSRHNPLRRVHKIVAKRDSGLIINGEVVNKNICEIEYPSWGWSLGGTYISFLDNKLYFIALELKFPEGSNGPFAKWNASRVVRLICFDPTIGMCDMYDIDEKFGTITKTDKYLYLLYGVHEYSSKLAVLDLTSGVIQEITQFDGPIRQISDQYIIYESKLADNSRYLYAVELSTCKIKKLPHFIPEAYMMKVNRFLLSHATLYWSHHNDGVCAFIRPCNNDDEHMDFKYDLTVSASDKM